MTQPASSDLQSTYPPNNALRVGVAVAGTEGEFMVSVQGELVQCGYITPGNWANNNPVALLRGEASWLALGTVGSSPAQTVMGTASGSLTLTTTPTDIPGALVTVTTGITSYHATAVFDTAVNVAGTTLAIGALVIDGVTQTGSAQFSSASSVARATVTQQWMGTLGEGVHTFQLQGYKTLAAATIVHVVSQTNLVVRLGA